ncbi:MAG: sulfotransferase domain-containing protein [Paracoccaceae bacterium]
MSAPRILCIGTHHKTGTVWMRKTWRAVSADQGIPFMQLYRAAAMERLAPDGPQIVVNWSSSFPEALLARDDVRVLHVIRDPRDVLVSGMRYHRTAPLGNEKHLRKRRPDWDGMTYQDWLNALPDDHARLRFEMENIHATTLRGMLAFPYDDLKTVTLRYEDLIADHDCAAMRAALDGFGIAGLDVDRAVARYWDNSVFGGLADPANRSERLEGHMRAVRPAQWRTRLPRAVAATYAERHQSALERLGYATDAAWVEDCPLEVPQTEGPIPTTA